MIEGMMDALKLGTKITGIFDRLTSDTDIKAEFEKHGKIDGTFTLGHYRVSFSVFDQKKIVDAEVKNIE